MVERQPRYVFLDQQLSDRQIVGLNNLSPARIVFEKLIPEIDVTDDVQRTTLSPRKIMISNDGNTLVLGYNDFAPGRETEGYGHSVRVNFLGLDNFSVTNSSDDEPLHFTKVGNLEWTICQSVQSLKK